MALFKEMYLIESTVSKKVKMSSLEEALESLRSAESNLRMGVAKLFAFAGGYLEVKWEFNEEFKVEEASDRLEEVIKLVPQFFPKIYVSGYCVGYKR
ncbi:MAG: hypothetical protein QXY49_01440 [Thermofilaceae archaeon]